MSNAFLFSHGSILFLGIPIYLLIARQFAFQRVNTLFAFAISYLLGELAIVLTMVASSHLFGAFNWYLIFGTIPLLWILLIYACRNSSGALLQHLSPTREIVIPLAFVALLCLQNIELSFYSPLIAWDARSIWFFHGKAFYFDNAISTGFLKNPLYRWSHPEYPPLIPLLAVFHTHLSGGWDEIFCKSFVFLHWFCSLLCLYFSLRLLRVPIAIAAASTAIVQLLFARNAHLGYGDSISGLAFLLGIILLTKSLDNYQAIPKRSRFFLSLSTLFFVSAALSKQEGLLFSGAALLFAIGLSFFLHRQAIRSLVTALLALAALVSPWYLYIQLKGISGEYSWTFAQLLNMSFTELAQRTEQIVIYGYQSALSVWGPSMLFIYLAALLSSGFGLSNKAARFAILLNLLLLLALPLLIYLIYLSSPIDLGWHLQTSAERLITVLGMLSLFALSLSSAAKEINN